MENIKETKKELLDCIHNLMAILDSPLGRRRFPDQFSKEACEIGRKILENNNCLTCYTK
jgi:hypothetical protein